MVLQELELHRAASWEKEKGFVGKLKAVGQHGEVTIRLSDEACRKILLLAAQGIEDSARAVSGMLVEESVALVLEAPKND